MRNALAVLWSLVMALMAGMLRLFGGWADNSEKQPYMEEYASADGLEDVVARYEHAGYTVEVADGTRRCENVPANWNASRAIFCRNQQHGPAVMVVKHGSGVDTAMCVKCFRWNAQPCGWC